MSGFSDVNDLIGIVLDDLEGPLPSDILQVWNPCSCPWEQTAGGPGEAGKCTVLRLPDAEDSLHLLLARGSVNRALSLSLPHKPVFPVTGRWLRWHLRKLRGQDTGWVTGQDSGGQAVWFSNLLMHFGPQINCELCEGSNCCTAYRN